MTRRMLDSNLWTNEHFGEMPMMARLLLLGIINHADDQGRVKGHSVFLRAQIFPYDDICKEEIESCLNMIAANGTIELYDAGGKRYVQLLNWWEYQSLQFASPSEHPRPQGWQDRIRYNAKGGAILTCNWITPQGAQPDDTCDQEGNPLTNTTVILARNPGGRPRKTQVETQVGIDVETQIEIEDQVEDQDKETTTTAAAAQAGVARVWKAWDANMPGTRTPVIVDGVNALLDDYSPAEIEEAITIAVKANIRTLRYIEGALAKGVFKDAPSASAFAPKVPDANKEALATRAKLARQSLRTAEKFGTRIDPQWQRDIEAAKELRLI